MKGFSLSSLSNCSSSFLAELHIPAISDARFPPPPEEPHDIDDRFPARFSVLHHPTNTKPTSVPEIGGKGEGTHLRRTTPRSNGSQQVNHAIICLPPLPAVIAVVPPNAPPGRGLPPQQRLQHVHRRARRGGRGRGG